MGRTKKESKDAGVIYLNANGSYIEEKERFMRSGSKLSATRRI